MKHILKLSLLALIAIGIFCSCKKKDEKICPESNCVLSFDRDTVVFDTTVFTGVKTITKRLRVFNNNENAVEISEISVPESSPFSLVIDGKRTNSLKDVFLRGEDFLLILVEATFNENGSDSIMIVEDYLKFITNGQEQSVVLAAPTQDVYLHNGNTICDETWKNNKPHLIYNGVLVDAGCKLTIEPGCKIYSAGRSGIYILGSIESIGTAEDPIIFTDARLDNPDYDDAFGVWEGIILANGSENNIFEWNIINNAVSGIFLATNNMDGTIDNIIGHTFINTIGGNANVPSFNVQELQITPGIGFYAANSEVLVYNSLITNCTFSSAYVYGEGTYYFLNNTLANYPNAPASFNRDKDLRTFQALNTVDGVNGGSMDLILHNNIIWGENSATEPEDNLDELLLLATDNFNFNVLDVSNNIIKTQEFEDLLADGNIIETDSKKSPFSDSVPNTTLIPYDFRIWEGSAAIDAGVADANINLPEVNIDLKNEARDVNWDIGAYEYKP